MPSWSGWGRNVCLVPRYEGDRTPTSRASHRGLPASGLMSVTEDDTTISRRWGNWLKVDSMRCKRCGVFYPPTSSELESLGLPGVPDVDDVRDPTESRMSTCTFGNVDGGRVMISVSDAVVDFTVWVGGQKEGWTSVRFKAINHLDGIIKHLQKGVVQDGG